MSGDETAEEAQVVEFAERTSEARRVLVERQREYAQQQAVAARYVSALNRDYNAPDISWREQTLREKAVELAIRMGTINPENMIKTAERIYAFLRGSEQ